jgi:hypothetical protein
MATLDTLNKLAAAVPVVNQQAQDQLEAARKIQMQNALGQAPASVNAVRGAQSVAPASVAASSQNAVQTTAANNQGLAKVASTGIAAQSAEQQVQQRVAAAGQAEAQAAAANAQGLALNRAEIQTNKAITRDEVASAKRVASIGLDQDNKLLDISLKQRRELDALGRDVKAKLVDSRLQFERDEAGRKFSNDRQLSDYAISSAKSDVELQSRMQDMKQAYETKIQLLDHVNQKILEAVNQGFLNNEQKLDYEQKVKLLNMHKEIEAQINAAKAKAANTQMIFTGAGMAIGAAVGGPAGAMVGGAVGSIAGGTVAEATA